MCVTRWSLPTLNFHFIKISPWTWADIGSCCDGNRSIRCFPRLLSESLFTASCHRQRVAHSRFSFSCARLAVVLEGNISTSLWNGNLDWRTWVAGEKLGHNLEIISRSFHDHSTKLSHLPNQMEIVIIFHRFSCLCLRSAESRYRLINCCLIKIYCL